MATRALHYPCPVLPYLMACLLICSALQGCARSSQPGKGPSGASTAAAHPASESPYRIAPPDMLKVEVERIIPGEPHHLEAYDVLKIEVPGSVQIAPIAAMYLVEGEGTVNLGAPYGRVQVAGMTIEQAEEAIAKHLRPILQVPRASVELARTQKYPPLGSDRVYLVEPDGTINLGQYGAVRVAGMTIPEAKKVVDQQLSKFMRSPNAVVRMAGFNSAVYYVIIGQGSEGPSRVYRLLWTGNETVLDALSQIGPFPDLSDANVSVTRPPETTGGKATILPVDWEGISRRAIDTTNHRIFPRDRILVEKPSGRGTTAHDAAPPK